MAKKRLTPQDRTALVEWEELIASIRENSDINPSDTEAEIRARRERLEKDDEEWFRYYFAMYYSCEAADFHKKATRRLTRNNRWYEVRAWSRELAKSARSMMEISKLAITRKIRNVLLISNSQDNAQRLLLPFMANFEENQRIIQDYGMQKKPGYWETGEFTIMAGCSFRAIGAGQSPRGTRNKNFRPDFILVDDIDTDEECRNPERIKTKWKWLEEALIPTMSVSGNYRILFNGNIIAADCCIKRAIEKATELKEKGIGHVDIINIRDRNGVSVWPEKNSEEDIDLFLSLVSAAARQKEFFNNPVAEGEIFKDIIYGKVPPLSKFKFLVIYGDPAPGENKTKKSSTKAVFLLGKLAGKLYVIKGFLGRETNATFIEWYIRLLEFVNGKTNVYCYMENNKLQDPFFQQVFQPIIRRIRRQRKISLYIQGDEEKKTDKATRIETNLEPLNSEGNLIFNEAEKDNPHMKMLTDQFSLFNLMLTYPADGPDCVEGGNRIIDRKAHQAEKPAVISTRKMRAHNKYRL
ncbi:MULTISPECIES: hypothetical protein [Bacteroidaceae]|jgi:hypothetical protein|uniref:hypothetical protein n=1 Tax=Bacteroidaceae TaxID=815 RepID=UPI00189A91F2|nr:MULTISPECIES: hypothetical protein [Bacteroidaceae]MDB1028065.1 hypothetical protein [Phocaeicola vulgatus]